MKNYLFIFILLSTFLGCQNKHKKSNAIKTNDYLVIQEIKKKQKKFNIYPPTVYDSCLSFSFGADSTEVIYLSFKAYEGYLEDIYKLKNLRHLSISGGDEIPDISHFPELLAFSIGGQKDTIPNLTLKNMKKLRQLRINMNLLSISLSDNDKLQEVSISGSTLNKFVVSNCNSLIGLKLFDTSLENISLKSLPSLRDLNVIANSLRKLDLDNIPVLSRVYLGKTCANMNKITQIYTYYSPFEKANKIRRVNYLSQEDIDKLKSKFKHCNFEYTYCE
ncbi:MAG: hypothetical protein EAZ06_07025 [Cytophagales bacterium]|nr:MAG: hypothetical protein EAZ06_07025 [Cytophagales bacterium]